jgi:phospholipid/cholesterol/gamma-HCH transport system substrate-binding protein
MIELEIRPGAGSQARVAALFLAAAGIALTLIYLLTGGGTAFFSPHTVLTTFVPDAAGLVKGSEVRLSGIPIGRVQKIGVSGSLDPLRIVRVDMKVDSRFLKNIPRDSQTLISADTLIGDQFVSIEEGKSPLPTLENATLATKPATDSIDRADLIKALRDELSQADDIVTQMASPDTQLGAFVLGSKEYDQLLIRVSTFQKAMHSFVGPDSQLGPALFSDTLYTDIRSKAAAADRILDGIQRGEGTAGRLFTSDGQYNDILRQLRDLRKSLADANQGLSDDTAYRSIRQMLAQTDATIAALNAGEGGAGRLMRDRQLYDSLIGSMKSLRELLADVGAHPQKYLRYKVR